MLAHTGLTQSLALGRRRRDHKWLRWKSPLVSYSVVCVCATALVLCVPNLFAMLTNDDLNSNHTSDDATPLCMLRNGRQP